MDTSDDVLNDFVGHLLRRVPNWPDMCKFDPGLGRHRPTSACFADVATADVSMSFSLEEPRLQDGGAVSDVIASNPGFGVARLGSNVVREQLSTPQSIVVDPTEDDPYHCLVVGAKSKKDKRKMAKESELVINPSNV